MLFVFVIEATKFSSEIGRGTGFLWQMQAAFVFKLSKNTLHVVSWESFQLLPRVRT